MLQRSSHRGRGLCRPNRRPSLLSVVASAAAAFGGTFASADAEAAQTTITISMTAPGAAPRILGPQVIAAKPAASMLYTLAATGAKPLTFTATGLPTTLALNVATGSITGTAPAAGSYPITVTVSNATGSIERVMTLVAGNTLAPTPPMGWNSYDSFGSSVTEADVMAAAQAQLAQLQPFGWNYVVIDYLWFDSEEAIDANGRLLPSITKFPSATGTLGLKPLADKIHALGLNFGIHIMRGISRKTVTANSPILGSTPPATASAAANTSDPCPWNTDMWGVNGATAAGQAWYDSIFAQYAAWGLDFVKVDDMINNALVPLVYHQPEVQAIRSAIDKTGRSIVFSLSPGPMQPADAVNLNASANMWRMVNDFWDVGGNSTLADVFTACSVWQAVGGLGVGHWPDADMLPLGFLGPRVPSFVHPSGPTAFNHNEQVSLMSLWSILPSPLMFGGNVPMLTTDAATGPWTVALLTNDEVLAVNQDADGARGKLVAQAGTTQVWAKDVSAGRKAVALFNRGNADAPVSVTFAQLGLTGSFSARDLWQRANLGPVTGTLSANVPWLGASLILLSPVGGTPDAGADAGPGAPDAGADAGPGTPDAGADAGSIGPDAGVDAAAGTDGSAGAGGIMGGADAQVGGPGSSGSPGGSGSGSGSGADHDGGDGQPNAGATGGASSGCTCTLGAARSPIDGGGLWLTSGIAAAVVARRRATRAASAARKLARVISVGRDRARAVQRS
jgi:alpha-galactosidase